MVKQTKTFKKGNVTKKALSAILAASMVMTSSSFVMAAPVEVEDVAVEAAAVAEDAAVADVVEDVEAGEESVGVVITSSTVKVEDATYTGEAVKPKVTVVATTQAGTQTLVEGKDFTVAYSNNEHATKAARATVTFIGDYVGNDSVTKEFTINPKTLTANDVQLTWNVAGFVYNGQEQKPVLAEITVLGGLNLTITTADVKLDAYSTAYDLKSVGEQKVKLTSQNADFVFDTSIDNKTYTIEKGDFSKCKVEVAPSFYTGSPVAAEVTVKDAANNVVDPSTYDILYFDADGKSASGPQTDIADDYKIQLVSKGNGNFAAGGVIDTTYDIVASSLEEAVKKASVAGKKVTVDSATGDIECKLTYTGKDQILTKNDVVIPGLREGSDYTFAISGSVKDATDTATITITGKNSFAAASPETIAVKVAPMAINTKDFTITAKAKKLADVADKPGVSDMVITIKKGDLTLKSGTDFQILDNSADNIDGAQRTVKIEGLGNYTTEDASGTGSDYIVVPYTQAYGKLIEQANVVVGAGNPQKWTGKQITPAVVVTDGGDTLRKDVDYTVAYGQNVDCGEDAGKVIITGIGDYEGTQEVTFDIKGTDITNLFKATASNVTVDAVKAGNGKSTPVVKFNNGASVPNDFTYTVKYKKGTVELTDALFKTLVEGDTVDVEVTGTGKYSGMISTTYDVVDAKNLAEYIDVADIADQAYTGNAIEPNVAVTVKAAHPGTVVTKDKDYKITYMANTEVGTAYAIVSGIGEYAGEVVKTFKIVGEMPQEIVVLEAQERDLGNGTRTLNSKATKIKYTTAPKTAVTYTSSDENVVTVDAEGNLKYTGLGEATITIEAKAENGYKAAKKEIKVVVKLAKPSFTPFSKNNAFTLTSSTVKGAEKFEVQYATKKNFSNAKTKTFTTTTAGKIRQVKVAAADKRTYYVRVRAVSGTTKSAWSGVKTVATK